jgi:hydroxymethylbilane synthase
VTFRLGSRGSALALTQAETVAAGLRAGGAEVEIVPIRTAGDRLAQARLAEVGGKGLFVSDIEAALREGRVDLAVHSLKDMPAVLPAGLVLAVFPRREDPADVLVSRGPGGLGGLAAGARVGTDSPRRRLLLLARRPDLRVVPARGNVDTRLRRLEAGAYDAVVLARAGLLRLGLRPAHAETLPTDEFLPAVGQGILGVETRAEDEALRARLAPLDDPPTRAEALAERAFLAALGADCRAAVAARARWQTGRLRLRGWVANPADGRAVADLAEGPADAAELLGAALARRLLERGGGELLAAAREMDRA